MIDWYSAATSGTSLTTGASYTPSITASTTYYAQARIVATGCVSARTPVVAKVINAPNIVLSSGAKNQYAEVNYTSTPVIYTTSSTTSFNWGNTGLPSGINASANGQTYTITGKPTTAGTYAYNINAIENEHGCSSTISGMLIINVHSSVKGPATAASTNTWTAGTNTISDLVAVVHNCTRSSTLTTTDAFLKQYTIVNGVYYYTWQCAYDDRTSLCPSGWSMAAIQQRANVTQSMLPQTGYVEGSTLVASSYPSWWTESSGYAASLGYYATAHEIYNGIVNTGARSRWRGYPVRCVK